MEIKVLRRNKSVAVNFNNPVRGKNKTMHNFRSFSNIPQFTYNNL